MVCCRDNEFTSALRYIELHILSALLSRLRFIFSFFVARIAGSHMLRLSDTL